MSRDTATPILKLLVIIVDRDQKKYIDKILHEEHVPLHFECMGEGTAASEISELLGLGSVDKSVLMCIQPDRKADYLMEKLTNTMHFHKPGTGISFTMPLSGVSSRIMEMLDSDKRKEIEHHMEKEVSKMNSNTTHDLIMAIVNHGFTDDVMTAARAAGATGGTIIHARGVAHEDSVKFFGISVQPEKEIVLVITTHETKAKIMQAICRECGTKTSARGMVFSLPVDSVSNL